MRGTKSFTSAVSVYDESRLAIIRVMKTIRLALGFALAATAAVLAQGRGGGPAPAPVNLPADSPRVTALKQEAIAEVDKLKDFSQQAVDQIFSYGELGFQEVETSRYLIELLKKNGFQVEESVAGIPTAFMATWGNGKPVIALGSDIDGIPQSSQKPGVAYHDPLIDGAPGHGEGHNSGLVVNITAALVLKKMMARDPAVRLATAVERGDKVPTTSKAFGGHVLLADL